MKKLVTLFFAGLALAASAQTNVVKISALPSATTPLAGTEIVPLNQSGTTKTVTVSQLILAATSQNNATSNALESAVASAVSSGNTASNALAAAVASNVAWDLASSNALAARITATAAADVATSNALASAVGAAYGTNNPAGFQNSAQVAAAAAAAVAGFGSVGVTNNGTATLGVLNYAALNLGTNDASTAFTVNLAAASLQAVTFTNKTSSNLFLSNAATGQNVTLIVNNGDSTARSTFYPPGMIQISSAGGYLQIGAKKTCVFNFLVFGTNVLMSVANQQN